tara:strand:+ start:7371 stop:9320 length:1950 start_codon:yes stop_codon:yes gene_type:complete
MATNGCLHFGLGTGNINYNNYCGDYTPDPLPQYNYTLFPFWTDLIRDNNSKMLAKNFSDKTVFGWYNLREYNRSNTDNSFEVILWTNDTYEYRYGGLNIINHDVLIGEQGSSSEIYTYLYYDECNTGTTNSSSCVSTDWNNSTFNTLLESGGSLYSDGSDNSLDCSNPLNDINCTGYWEAYDDLQCDLDSQYAPFCPGYRQEESVAFFDDSSVDYGFIDEQEQYATGMFIEDYDEYGYHEESMTQYDIFEDDIFFEPMFIEEEYDIFFEEFESFEAESFLPSMQETDFEMLLVFNDFEGHTPDHLPLRLEDELLEEFIFQETILLENFEEPETFIEFETIEELEEWFEEETGTEEELNYDEETEEEFIEEVFEEEAVEEVFEDIEEMREEMEEERIAEAEEGRVEELQEEDVVIGEELSEGKSSITREMALAVVTSTIRTAKQSVYTTVHGNTSTNSTSNSGMSSSTTSSSSGSISNSPSISEQFSSSTAQTNQILDMTTTAVTTTSTSTMSSDISSTATSSVSNNTTTSQSIQDTIDVSISDQGMDEDSQELVESIIANNLQQAQQEVETKQQETGQYGSENTIIAYMGFVPNFNNYRLVTMPDQDVWYEPTALYDNNVLSDNIEGFYQMAGQSLETLSKMRKLQPNL